MNVTYKNIHTSKDESQIFNSSVTVTQTLVGESEKRIPYLLRGLPCEFYTDPVTEY